MSHVNTTYATPGPDPSLLTGQKAPPFQRASSSLAATEPADPTAPTPAPTKSRVSAILAGVIPHHRQPDVPVVPNTASTHAQDSAAKPSPYKDYVYSSGATASAPESSPAAAQRKGNASGVLILLPIPELQSPPASAGEKASKKIDNSPDWMVYSLPPVGSTNVHGAMAAAKQVTKKIPIEKHTTLRCLKRLPTDPNLLSQLQILHPPSTHEVSLSSLFSAYTKKSPTAQLLASSSSTLVSHPTKHLEPLSSRLAASAWSNEPTHTRFAKPEWYNLEKVDAQTNNATGRESWAEVAQSVVNLVQEWCAEGQEQKWELDVDILADDLEECVEAGAKEMIKATA